MGRHGRKKPIADQVRVRMYRQGLGDCFLLTFTRGGQTSHVLIDCGVFKSTDDAADKMSRVLADVHAATNGRLDLAIATHEHWDHLSGFSQAPDQLRDLKIERLWTAWTEDPGHPLAKTLRARRRMRIRLVEAMLERLETRGSALSKQRDAESLADRIRGVRRVLEFEGALGASAAGDEIAAAFEALKRKAGSERTSYLRPGQKPLAIPGIPDTRVYVLGPPESEKDLHRLESERQGVLYQVAARLAAERGLVAALGLLDEETPHDGKEWQGLTQPFDRHHGVTLQRARGKNFFRRHYYAPMQQWRAIDDDWLGAAGSLALHLNSYTNNTSLALAIELLPSGRVLLFPGDAQLGNWDTWFALQWKQGSERVRAQDLLARTVLYKVSHHGSHNGTLKARGLELMTHPELVAMIPVNQAKAKRLGFRMPFGKLLERLQERARQRVLRADRDPKRPPGVSISDWKLFSNRVTRTPLYLDYTLQFD